MPSKKLRDRAPKAAPGPADEIPSLAACAPFHEAYTQLLDGLPSSVVEKVKARAEVRGLDLTADEDAVRDLLETAREAYERKKAGSRLAAAKRRASKKAGAAAALESAPAAFEAAPADALEATQSQPHCPRASEPIFLFARLYSDAAPHYVALLLLDH